MKKSSLALLMAMLVLLTAVLVSGMVMASAEDAVDYEAAVFKADGTQVNTGSFADMIAWTHATANNAGWPYELKLYKDVTIELSDALFSGVTFEIEGHKLTKIDGQGHTIKLGTTILEKSRSVEYFVFDCWTHGGTVTFKDIVFDGGCDKTTNYWGKVGTYGAPIQARTYMAVVLDGCTMQNFYSMSRTLCINVAARAEVAENAGLYLKDTKIVGNEILYDYAGPGANAIGVMHLATLKQDVEYNIYVSGNTVVKDNYDVTESNRPGYPNANICLEAYVAAYGTAVSLVVEDDFTGEVGVVLKAQEELAVGDATTRGDVFFEGESYDANGDYARYGKVFVYLRPTSASTYVKKYVEPANGDSVAFANKNGNWGSLLVDTPSTVLDTVTFTVKDSTNADLITYTEKLSVGDALPTWATWSDGEATTTTHTAGTKAYTTTLSADVQALTFANDEKTVTYAGTLAECVANATDKAIIKLYTDMTLTTYLDVYGNKISKIDGQNHTVYVDGDAVKSAAGYGNYYIWAGSGDVTLKDIHFIGQTKTWYDAQTDKNNPDWTAATTFGTAAGTIAPIQLSLSIGQFVMDGCSMKYFQAASYASCITFNALTGLASYTDNHGIWLVDTTLTLNKNTGANASNKANVIYVPASTNASNYGPKIHVSGNTVVENNYDKGGNAESSIHVEQSSTKQASAVIVELDFTGRVCVGTSVVGNDPSAGKRGPVFYRADETGAYATGSVFSYNENYKAIGPVLTETLSDFLSGSAYKGYWAESKTDLVTFTIKDMNGNVLRTWKIALDNGNALPADAEWTADGSTVVTTHVKGVKSYENFLVIVDTVTFTVKDSANNVLFTYTEDLEAGDALPTWATWSDGQTTHTAGVTAYTATAAADFAAVFADGDATVPTYAGTLAECVANATNMAVIKLYTDMTLTSHFDVEGTKISKIDGQDHTVYVDGDAIKAATGYGNYYIWAGSGDVTLKDIHFIGQTKTWYDAQTDKNNPDWTTATTFGTSSGIIAPITLSYSIGRFVMDGCSMKYFQAASYASCITFNALTGLSTYTDNHGIWLVDTTLTLNKNTSANASNKANVIYVPASTNASNYGPKIHVSGNTVVENNYDKAGNAESSIHVERNTAKQASTLIVEPDFTGRVCVGTSAVDPTEEAPRGAVFFRVDENGACATGSVFAYSATYRVIVPVTTEAINFLDGSSYTGYWAVYKELIGIDVDNVAGQGNIDKDKFGFTLYLPIYADPEASTVVVKFKGNEILTKELSDLEYVANIVGDGIGRYQLDTVYVGMAELTEDIVVELWNKTTNAVVNTTDPYSAKHYAKQLIENDATPLAAKEALASLLQYGAEVQTFFNYNTDNLAMTAEEKTAWSALIVDVDTNKIVTTNANESVKATSTGSADGVTVTGVSLTMENQMSLRLYFKLAEGKSIEDYDLSHPYVEKGNNTYYMEAKNIGTAKLATAVTFTIFDGTDTLTYSASPMSYVLGVNNAEVGETITADLKDACEALYYYYAAIADCFNSVTDTTGFSVDNTNLILTADTPDNGYSAPSTMTE